MLNSIIIQGRLTKAPELRHTQSNTAVCSFTLAVERDRKDADGSRKADFIDCVAWGKTAEFVSQWFGKGQLAIARGRLEGRDWEDKQGNKRRSWEVICEAVNFCGGAEKRGRPEDISAEPGFDLPSGGDFEELGDDDDPPF